MMKFAKKYSPFFILTTLSILIFAFQWALLSSRASIEQYPFVHQDFWRRIIDALYYAGRSTEAFIHPPVPSLLYSLSLGFGPGVLLVTNIAHFILGIWIVYIVAYEVSEDKKIGLISAILFASNSMILQQFNYYGLVDGWATIWILMAFWTWLKWYKTKKWGFLLASGIISGIASLIQLSGFFLLPFFLLIIAKDFRNKKKYREIIRNSLVLVIPVVIINAIFSLYLLVNFHNPFYSRIEHLNFVTPTLTNLPFYTFVTLAALSVPVCILAFGGIFYRFRTLNKYEPFIGFFSIFYVFFGIVYVWSDGRFFIYWAFPFLYFAAVALVTLYKHSKPMSIAAIVLLAGICLYTQLYGAGHYTIPIGPYTEILYEKQVGPYDKQTGAKINQKSEPFYLYAIYFMDLDARIKNNPEISYYRDTVDPEDVKETVEEGIKLSGENTLCVSLSREHFVRTHQFVYYGQLLKKKIVYGDCSSYQYVITETDQAKFRVLYRNKGFSLQDQVVLPPK